MTNSPNEKLLVDRLLELGGNFKPQVAVENGVPFALIPSGMTVQSLEHLAPLTRIKQAVSILEAGSFCDYVNRFKNEDTLIFANVTETAAVFTAVLDYHGPAKPKYGSHTARFEMIQTPEWKTWMAANRVAMDQVKFATWLEDNLKLIVEPDSADLLEMVRTLHGHNNARFNTALRLDNGAYSVSYDEDTQVKGTSTTRAGEFELPATIKAGIAVFQGCDKYAVSARLKSRCTERKLVLHFETISVHEIVRESILLAVKQVADKTGIIPLIGAP